MTIYEIYEHYNYNWSSVCRELKIGTTTIIRWRQRGCIPIRSQMIIEKRTNGLFKANLEHDIVNTGVAKLPGEKFIAK